MGYEELLNALMNLSVRDAVNVGKGAAGSIVDANKNMVKGVAKAGKVASKVANAPLAVPIGAAKMAAEGGYGTGANLAKGMRTGTQFNRGGRPVASRLATEPPIEMNPYLNNMNTAPMPGSVGQQGDYNMDLKYRGKPQTPQIVGGGSTLAPANLRGAASGGFGGEGGAAGMGVQGIRDINQMSPEEEELMRAIIAQRMMAAQGANLVGQPATAPRYTG